MMWWDMARGWAEREPLAMVSVLACEGRPRAGRARACWYPQAAPGAPSGAALEFRAIEQARRALDLAPGSWRVQDYPLGPLLGQCCGGRVRLLIEHLDFRGLAALQGMHEGALLVSHFSPSGSTGTGSSMGSPRRFPRGPTSPKPGPAFSKRSASGGARSICSGRGMSARR
jgi:xanthine/CO dehydrogenase XdhC/CoxF family maturation factor